MRKFALTFLCILCFLHSCKTNDTNAAEISLDQLKLFITPCEENYLKIEAVGKKHTAPAKQLELNIPEIQTDSAFTLTDGEFQYKNYKIKKEKDGYSLLVNEELRYRSVFYYEDGEIEEERYYPDNQGYYGFGQVSKTLDLSGNRLVIYHEPVYGDQTYLYIPFYLTDQKGSVYYNANGYDKIKFPKNQEDPVVYSSDTGRISSYYRDNNTYQEAVSSFYQISNSSSLPPKWAFGFIQSKYGYKNSKEIIDLVETFQQKKIQLSSIVLDLYWFKKMGDLDWNKENFPDPKALDTYLEENGVKLIAISEPFFTVDSLCYEEFSKKDFFAKDKNGKIVKWNDWWCFDSPSGSVINPLHKEAKKLLGNKYIQMMESGIDGFWTDLGEPERVPATALFNGMEERFFHNYFNREWSKIIHASIKEKFPDRRLFILSRSGYTGSGQYGVSTWSGDVPTSFQGLQQQIVQGVSSGLSGFTYWGSDVGGFTPAYSSPELMIRWYQFGVFTPIFRAHGTGSREPWSAGEEAEKILKQQIDLRYQLLPYIYSIARTSYQDGIPMMRPLFFLESGEKFPQKYLNTQYLYGPSFLIAPVTQEMIFSNEKKIYLPRGNWYDFETLGKWDGGQEYTLKVKKESIPVFLREGSIIPMDYQGKKALLLIPADGIKSDFVYYDDDGETEKYKTGEYEEISYHLDGFTLTIESKDPKNLTGELLLLLPEKTKTKSPGWKKEGIYQTKAVSVRPQLSL